MDPFFYTEILDRTLVPFIQDAYTVSHRLMMDNDPKHTSLHARTFINNNNINWWVTQFMATLQEKRMMIFPSRKMRSETN